MFCGECGTRNPDTNQFCRNCGKPLVRKQQAAIPAGPSSNPQPAQTARQPAPAPAIPYQQPAAASSPAATAPPGKVRNWLGIASLILGILSWVILTVLFAAGAILLGIAGTVLFRKTSGRIGISGIIGMILAIIAIIVSVML